MKANALPVHSPLVFELEGCPCHSPSFTLSVHLLLPSFYNYWLQHSSQNSTKRLCIHQTTNMVNTRSTKPLLWEPGNGNPHFAFRSLPLEIQTNVVSYLPESKTWYPISGTTQEEFIMLSRDCYLDFAPAFFQTRYWSFDDINNFLHNFLDKASPMVRSNIRRLRWRMAPDEYTLASPLVFKRPETPTIDTFAIPRRDTLILTKALKTYPELKHLKSLDVLYRYDRIRNHGVMKEVSDRGVESMALCLVLSEWYREDFHELSNAMEEIFKNRARWDRVTTMNGLQEFPGKWVWDGVVVHFRSWDKSCRCGCCEK